ncbi:MAG: FecR domain-containing protein [Syntrophorhabdaceae bacterium]|nr:FecR domain-containing protein [Syntrophorhabdaceae bacterium]
MKSSRMMLMGLLAGFLLFTAGHVHGADPDALYVRHIEGVVELAEAESPQWMEAAVNTPLVEGDTVRTGASGKAELFLKDGSVVRIGKSSMMKIVAVEPGGVEFKLDRGMAYIVAMGSKEVPIFFDTPSAALDITTPATLRVDAYDGGICEVSIYKGEVHAAQEKGRMPVRAGERLVLRMDGSAPVLAGLRAGDEWLRWNSDRDRAVLSTYGTGESYAYLPDELKTYSSDLDANGQWVYTPEYNYVWVPTVITVSTWSPYRFGRWVWIRGSYVWVGYEPWGWAPYHYGRWTHHRTAGWCWVPPARGHVRWEPAQVAWVHSSRQVGWVPLAPGESYDRRKAPVIHQTNVYNVYNNVTVERSVSTARTAYKNAGVTNAVVTMERDTLLRQKAARVNVAKTGSVPLRKVSLPANVVPARIGNAQAQPAVREKTPAPTRATGAPARGITSPGVTSSSQPKVSTAPAPVATRGNPANQPSTAPSLNTRIDNARTTNVQPSAGQRAPNTPVTERKISGNQQQTTAPGMRTTGGAGIPRAPGPQVPAVQRGTSPAANARGEISVKPLEQRINDNRSSSGPKAAGPVPPTPSTVRPQLQQIGTRSTPAAPQAAVPQGNRAVANPSTVSTGPIQARPITQASPARNNAATVNTPAGIPVRNKPAAVTATQTRPEVRSPEPPRQAAPRTEQKPVAVHKENPRQPQAVKPGPVSEKATTSFASPAPVTAPQPGAVIEKDRGADPQTPGPARDREKGPQFQQGSSAKKN